MRLLRRYLHLIILVSWAGAAQAATPSQRDVAYGPDPAQKLDIYQPGPSQNAPIILFVHGGAWRLGDKAADRVVENKSVHYVGQGKIFISMNYRLDVTPLEQAKDVANAVRFVQKHASSWGGDAKHMLLMGHSAGAHLVALLTADPQAYQLTPWRGTVSLDSAALDVPAIMNRRHLGFYDRAFGTDEAFWKAASPLWQIKPGSPPMLLVCSSQRIDACPQARLYKTKAASQQNQVELLPVDKSHMEINNDLGAASDYTDAVDRFITSVTH